MESSGQHWHPALQYAVLSDRGLRRANNQDSFAAVPATGTSYWQRRGHLFLVADGMGAHAAGEMASQMASELIPLTYGKHGELPPPDALNVAICEANRQINVRGNANRDFQGMGTTTSSLLILPEGAVIGHVGDSRIYRLRGDRLEQLTADHSLSWEVRGAKEQTIAFLAEKFPNGIPKNIITRSLGPCPDVLVDLEGPIPIQPGDTFLLCSDGLSGPILDSELAAVLSLFPPEEAVHVLVDLANLRGGLDNITILVIRVNDPTMRDVAKIAQVSRSSTETSQSHSSSNPDTGYPTHHSSSDRETKKHSRSKWSDPLRWFILAASGSSAFLGLVAGLAVPEMKLAAGILTAAGSALVGAIAGIVLKKQLVGEPKAAPWYLTKRGAGPYTCTPVGYDPDFMQKLARLTLQLREASERSGWEIDSDPFRQHYEKAVAASNTGEHKIAIWELCLAMRLLMEQLRTGRPDATIKDT